MKYFLRLKVGFFGLAIGVFANTPDALARGLTLDLGGNTGSYTGSILQLVFLLAILSLAPSILMMVTSFTRLVIVFSFLRSALGLQHSPPSTILISLSLFLTAFIMAPTIEKAYDEGIAPLVNEEITESEAFEKAIKPFHTFMIGQVREKDLGLFMDLSNTQKVNNPEDMPLKVLVPAFMISELHRAFEIGFLIFIPFLIIDMVVASILMSMGMMMVPPIMISLPFKLIFFVLIDGWFMMVGSLVRGFGVG